MLGGTGERFAPPLEDNPTPNPGKGRDLVVL